MLRASDDQDPYNYGCCMFKHNICSDQLEVPDGMPDSCYPLPLEFFVNPKCLLVPAATKASTTEADQSEAIGRAEKLKRNGPVEDFAGTS